MSLERISLRIIGVDPMLMHSSRLADPLDPLTKAIAAVSTKNSKTEADYAHIAELEWHGGLWLHNGKPCIPAQCIKRVLVDSAKRRRKGKIAKAAFMPDGPALLEYDGPRSIPELWADERFRHREVANVHGSRTVRTRPCFPSWSARISATFLPSLLNRAEVIELFSRAGPFGLGDYRPTFGRFRIEVLDGK